MAEKKVQENSISEEQNNQVDKEKSVQMLSQEKATNTEKPPPVMVPVPLPTVPLATTVSGRVAVMPIFTKTPPNDLYRRLLPAVLFLLTFVTVMTMLLVYMDTVALGAQQFRLNMSRDYELASIPQDSPSLIQYVRQVHLAPRPAPAADDPLVVTPTVRQLDKLFGPDYVGTFVEILPSGGATRTALALQRRGWRGLLARAAPRDYLALRANALHACLSPIDHPREVAYHEPSSPGGTFWSRVLCLPLYTVLAAGEATAADYLALAGGAAAGALRALPPGTTSVKVIEYLSSEPAQRNQTGAALAALNYTLLAAAPDSLLYVLRAPDAAA